MQHLFRGNGGTVQSTALARNVSVLAFALAPFALVGCLAASAPHGVAVASASPLPAPPPPAPAPAPAPQSETASKAAGFRLGWPIWIGIVCDDLEAQRRFYRDVLGLTERSVIVGSIWFDLDGKLLELFAKSNMPQYARVGVAFGFVVENIQSARATLLERGVTAVGDVDGGGGAHWAYFRDAEGNLFELVERAH
jgi:catechol 2,3-dioxygenase-like lactoylglutathione lyase family enzyme